MLRKQLNPEITRLLREHDSIPYENVAHRNKLKRQILLIMESIKLQEQFEGA